jgi:hypothetical protein
MPFESIVGHFHGLLMGRMRQDGTACHHPDKVPSKQAGIAGRLGFDFRPRTLGIAGFRSIVITAPGDGRAPKFWG